MSDPQITSTSSSGLPSLPVAASREGDFAAFERALHPEVVLGADPAVARTSAPARGRGAEGVADMFAGWALAAPPATVVGRPGIVWAVARQPKIVWA